MTYANLRIPGANVFPISTDCSSPISLASDNSGFVVLPMQKGLLGSVTDTNLAELSEGELLIFSGSKRGYLTTTRGLATRVYDNTTEAEFTDRNQRRTIHIDNVDRTSRPVSVLQHSHLQPSPDHGDDSSLKNVLALAIEIQLCEIVKGGMGDHLPAFLHLHPPNEKRTYLMAIGEQLAAIAGHSAEINKARIVRFTELLLIEALDLFLSLNSVQSRLLDGGKDLRMGKAIKAVHTTPEHPWTVSELAAIANMSRSLFAEKFKTTYNETPLNYVKQCRLHRAKILLTESAAPIDRIAQDCGYASQSAFISAFTAAIGSSPGRWRNLNKNSV